MSEPIQIESPSTFMIDPTSFVGKIQIGDTTPSVLNVKRFITQNTDPTTITNFLNGQEGQEIVLLGDGNTTLEHGTNIFLIDEVDLLLATDKAYSLIRLNSKWYQL